MASYVVVDHVPGFRRGAVVDLDTGRIAYRLAPDELDTLRLNLHALRPLEGEPDRANPATPEGRSLAG